MSYVITESCVDILDKKCMQECPVDSIYEGERALYINPDECIDCGACEWACPVQAIVYDVELAPEQEHLVGRAREWVETHDAKGGARNRGRVGIDHPQIAALPPRASQEA